MTDDVFDNEAVPAPTPIIPAVASPTVDQTAQLLSTIKNPDGTQKYPTIEAAFTGFANAQEHITRIESENEGFRVDKTKADTMEEMLAKMQANVSPQEPVPVTPTSAQPTLSEEQLNALVDARLDTRTEAQKQTDKLATFNKTLVDLYGDKAKEEFQARLKQKGFNAATVRALALDNPIAALNVLDINATQRSAGINPVSTIVVNHQLDGIGEAPTRKDFPTSDAHFKAMAIWTRAGGRL